MELFFGMEGGELWGPGLVRTVGVGFAVEGRGDVAWWGLVGWAVEAEGGEESG